MMAYKNSRRGTMYLLITAIVWGVSFVAQSVGMDYIGPFTYIAVYSLMGSLVLIPCICLLDRRDGKHFGFFGTRDLKEKNRLLKAGILCGLTLAVASCFQQTGIMYTTVGKAGFITTLYIVIVPLFNLFFGRRISIIVWIGIVLAVLGLYLLCITDSFFIGRGDMLILICALFFAVHITLMECVASEMDSLRISALQFFVSGICCGIMALLFEMPKMNHIVMAWKPLVYSGILTCGVGYTFQAIGQKWVNSIMASLILSLESVVAILAGWLLLGEKLSNREICGCIILFIAILFVQMEDLFYKSIKERRVPMKRKKQCE